MLGLSYVILPWVAATGPGNGPTLVLFAVLTAVGVAAGVLGAVRAARHRATDDAAADPRGFALEGRAA
jgi:hypothetical protein